MRTLVVTAALMTVAGVALAAEGDAPRITQSDIEAGNLSLKAIQRAGLAMFATPFTKERGYGDGPVGAVDRTTPGGRPTLAGNGMWLRINGLDSQTCMECHSIVSAATVPFTFGVGGVGGINNSAMFLPDDVDVNDDDGDGTATFTGRIINPPFLFGSGGVELLGKEMTEDLQALRAQAIANPDTPVALETKGVSFGTITANAQGVIDFSLLEGIEQDLVVRPFGRKGEFPTVRSFDVEAMAFHFGIQAVEKVGEGVDDDGDGTTDEITVGELSALSIFGTTLERPRAKKSRGAAATGFERFQAVGCADCHIPELTTNSRVLTYSFPEVPEDPDANVYFQTDLSKKPAGFQRTKDGGLAVPLFADLKRHDMGVGLTETVPGASVKTNQSFTTARLWGIADTAPYLHDGRAPTLTEAILMHGGEAKDARDAFDALSAAEKAELLAFLGTLRTPKNPAKRLVKRR